MKIGDEVVYAHDDHKLRYGKGKIQRHYRGWWVVMMADRREYYFHADELEPYDQWVGRQERSV